MGSTASEFITTNRLIENSEFSDISAQVFVCLMEPKHIDSVCEIEQLCFASPWKAHMFQEELEKNPLCRYLVLLDKKNPSCVVAYAGYWKVLEEGQITNGGSAAPVAAQGRRHLSDAADDGLCSR